ncbi:MAG: hypothetical protein J6Q55_00520 [Clostridia bacterium]|nr:hypothetical protein [Clostridia bacterium]
MDEPLPTGYIWQEIRHNPTAQDLDEMFAYLNCDAVFFGHKHELCDVKGAKVYCDVGSVGCHKHDYAQGVLITIEPNGKWGYERIYADYDRNTMKQQMLSSNLPDASSIFDYYFDKQD